MTTTVLLLGLAIRHQTIDKPTLQYYQQTFVIRQGDDVTRIPFQLPKPKPTLFVAFRRNENFAVWDDRGLTIRRGKKATSTRLGDIAVSPRAFTREEIVTTLKRIKDGLRTKDATALSGSKRLGTDVYFLVRWDDKDGKAWAEALIRVDLAAKKPIPQFIGKFDALSTATKLIDDKLQIVRGKLAIIGRSADSWSLSSFDPIDAKFSSQNLGGKLISYEALNPTQGLFVEQSSYGTTIAGRVDVMTGTRKILYEGREQSRFLDASSPEIVVASDAGKTKLVNCATGVVRTIPYVLEGRRTGDSILFWTPAQSPKAVWLMDPQTWEADARYTIGHM